MIVVALLSAADTTPLRVALRLGQTVALRVGPADDDPLLQAALLAGAQRAVRVWDEILKEVDYLGVAGALSRAVSHVGGTLVIAADRGQGAVGPAVAERLGVPHLCGVVGVELEGEGLLVQRRTLTGVQRLRGPGRAVLCVLPADEPAAPQEVVQQQPPEQAQPAAVEALTLESLGLSAAELQHRRHLQAAPSATPVQQHRPLRFASPDNLVRRLQRDGLLPRR